MLRNEPFLQEFLQLADLGWQQGWHERNGGNLSYRVPGELIAESISNSNSASGWHPIGAQVPDLANCYFLVTGSGQYFQNVLTQPERTVGLIQLDATGEHYRLLWGLSDGGPPTSELPSHLMNHQVCMKRSGGLHRVIYHSHPPNIIALTFVLPLKDEVFTRELWEIMTECPVIFPAGIGVIEWMVPGGREIAVRSSQLMEQYDVVVWAHHGIFCSGESFDSVFGLMHTVEKASEILVKVLAMGGKRQTIQPREFRDLARDFQLDLPEKFLFEK